MTNIKVDDKRMFLFSRDVILDSGQTYVYLPTVEYVKFYKEIERTQNCYLLVGLPHCDCADRASWPVIKMKIGDGKNKMWVFLTGFDYLNQSGTNTQICELMIKEEMVAVEDKHWVWLG